MTGEQLAWHLRTEARTVWNLARRRPALAAGVALAATIVGGALASGLVTLFVSPFSALSSAVSTALVLAFAGGLTWGLMSLAALAAGVVIPYALVVFPSATRLRLASVVRRVGLAVAGAGATLVDVIIASSSLLTALFALLIVVTAVTLTSAQRRHERTLRWLAGHLSEAAREFDPDAGGGWQIRNAEWDGERLVRAEAWYPATLRASDPNRRAGIERAVMWAMRGERQVYGLTWASGARMTRIVSEPPLPDRLVDGEWPDGLPGVVIGACALVHASEVVHTGGDPIGVLTWNPNAERDLLIAGVKGSGKTILGRGIVVRGLRRDWFLGGVMIIDGKASGDYASLEGRDGVMVVARTPEQWRAAFAHLLSFMQDRYEQDYEYQAGRGPKPDFPRMLLLVDEIQAVIAELGNEALDAISALARMARGARISLVFLTQRPDSKDAVPGAIRDQLEDRVAVGWMSEDGGRMMLGDAWRLVVADDDPTGESANQTSPRGRAVARIAGRLARVQVPWLDSPVMDPRVEILYPPRETAAAPAPPRGVPQARRAQDDDPPPAATTRPQRRGRMTD